MPARVNGSIREWPRVAAQLPKGINHRFRSLIGTNARSRDNTVLVDARVVGEFGETGKAVTAVAATDLFTSAAHGYSIGDRLKFSGLTGGAGISTVTTYTIIASGFTANDFRVSPNGVNGAQLDVTTDLTAGTVARQRQLYQGIGPSNAAVTPAIPGPRKR